MKIEEALVWGSLSAPWCAFWVSLRPALAFSWLLAGAAADCDILEERDGTDLKADFECCKRGDVVLRLIWSPEGP